ncbi:TetR/AcrR family transcriptional regulator [Alteromonas sp. ZYF713]|nr:TetR/AcrR family transcriptional regulator [Alteromonas sp. ZYF713]
MASKTAERILAAALTLFNEQGENAVTSVDIAMELDISPGNLYYHFKGKEQIIDGLVHWYSEAMQTLLRPATLEKVQAEDFFYFIAIVLDKQQLFRFMYRSPADLAEKYPKVKHWHKQQIRQLESSLTKLLLRFAAQEALLASPAEQRLMVDLIIMILTQANQYDDLRNNDDPQAQKFHALSLMMTALMPRFRLQETTVAQLRKAIEHHSMANLTLPAARGDT